MTLTKILFLSPHFDDETLAMGGTISKLCGHVKFVVAGFTGSEEAYSGENLTPDELLHESTNEAKEMSKILGVSKLYSPFDYRTWGFSSPKFRDMCLDTKSETIKLIINLIRREKPNIVVTTHYNDFHTDHRALALASKEAVYQAARKGICGSSEGFKEPLLLFGEVDMEGVTNINYTVFSSLKKSNLEAKWQGLQCYKNLVNTHAGIFKQQQGRDWIWNLARLRGMYAGVRYAEAFEIGNYQPKIKFEDLL